MLKLVEGWDPRVVQAVKSVLEDILIDYKLLWRDPIPHWVSSKGRVVLVGDAAHPHLPTSGAGGAVAVEDGATIAVLIAKLGKDIIPLALQAFHRLR
jgi:2-polyprenyl-6-methoxyphenol hydroxylase-like FAD-dependent oxidoreductase